jgi:hypothetical protein
MNMVLNNATHVIEYYRDKNEDVDVEIVAYGPGLHMLRTDSSPVQDRIKRSRTWCFPARSSSRPATTPREGRGARDPDRAGGDGGAVRPGAADGIAGSRLELRQP